MNKRLVTLGTRAVKRTSILVTLVTGCAVSPPDGPPLPSDAYFTGFNDAVTALADAVRRELDYRGEAAMQQKFAAAWEGTRPCACRASSRSCRASAS